MADQAGERWTGKRYTFTGAVETFPISLTDGQLVIEGLDALLVVQGGRTRRSIGRWVYEIPGSIGTFGTILALEDNGQRIAICGRDVLLPDGRYQAAPSGKLDILMEAGAFRELLEVVDALLGDHETSPVLDTETVTIRLHNDRHTSTRALIMIGSLFAALFLIVGLGYLASVYVGEKAALTAAAFLLPVISIAAVFLLTRSRKKETSYHLIFRGDQVGICSPSPSSANRSLQVREIKVEHLEYVERSRRTIGGELHYPAFELEFPNEELLGIRSMDTTFTERNPWPGVEATRTPRYLVGPAEIFWLHEYFSS